MVDERIVGVGIGDLDGRETLKVQVTDLGVDLPETFNGVPLVLEKFPPEPDTLPPEIEMIIEGMESLGPRERALLDEILGEDAELLGKDSESGGASE